MVTAHHPMARVGGKNAAWASHSIDVRLTQSCVGQTVLRQHGLADRYSIHTIAKMPPNQSLERTHQTVTKFAFANMSPAWRAAQLSRLASRGDALLLRELV